MVSSVNSSNGSSTFKTRKTDVLAGVIDSIVIFAVSGSLLHEASNNRLNTLKSKILYFFIFAPPIN